MPIIKTSVRPRVIGVLRTTDPENDSFVKRLSQEVAKIGLSTIVQEIFIGQSSLVIDDRGKLVFHYQEQGFELPRIILSRLGATDSSYGLYVLNHLGKLPWVKVINRVEAVSIARDKFRTLQLLSENGFKVPRSMLLGDRVDLAQAIDQIGSFPVIFKLNKGTYGIGVMIVDSMPSAKSVFETLAQLNQKIMVEEYLSDEPGVDYRLFVVGHKVVSAMKRIAQIKGEFRANIAQGGRGEVFDPPKDLIKQALAIRDKIGLDIAGIDFVYSNSHGFIPIEVNASPLMRELEKATGHNVAAEIIRYCLN